MELFDTHCHLDDEQFADAATVVARAEAAGVTRMLAVAVGRASSEACVALAGRFSSVYAAVGIQPNYVHEAEPGDWDAVVALAARPGVIALGETGLDRYWDFAPFELQQEYFSRHLALSQETGLPFIVHMRDCGPDITAMLREARRRGPLRGIMHSFTGDAALQEECLELGLHISFAGMVTFKKSQELREVAARTPADRLLIETDAPYLSPHPHRGVKPNEPALLIHTLACLAEARGVTPEELAEQTTRNAVELFGLEKSA